MSEIIIFDTEYTSWKGSLESNWEKANEHREIIEIGAIKVSSNENIVGKFSVIVKPYINKTLSVYIKELTGINQSDIDERGLNLVEALIKFKQFCGNEGVILALSNGGDDRIIGENLKLINETFYLNNVIFIDVQPTVKKIFGAEKHLSIEWIANELGIDPVIHSAMFDSISLFKCINKLKIFHNYIKLSRKYFDNFKVPLFPNGNIHNLNIFN
jgi:inhibitor of KinA sporulation pathway (predicted exonuclease)